nr:hypothetical protein [Herbidospora cretacea]
MGDQHVARLHVAVQDVGGVGGAQGAQQVGADLGDQAGREGAVFVHDLFEGAALDEFHDDPRHAADLDGVEDRRHGGVVDTCGGAAFADHAFAEFGALILGQPGILADLLDRDLAPEGAVDGTPDRAHRAAPQGRYQFVALRQQPALHD